MPSSKGYVRDYTQEYKTEKARGELADGAKRKKARRLAVKKGMVRPNDGKDIDHRQPLSKGGSNDASNLRVEAASTNRSFPRDSSGAMVKNEPKKK